MSRPPRLRRCARLALIWFVLPGLPGFSAASVAAAAILADYVTCVPGAAYQVSRTGKLETAPSTPAGADPQSFSVDLRNGAITGLGPGTSGAGDVRIRRSDDGGSWWAVWLPRAGSAGTGIDWLQLTLQPRGEGEAPVSFLAVLAGRIVSGVCLAAPPAAIRGD